MSHLVELTPNATLVVIDVQEGFDEPRWGRRNNLQAESNVGRILAAWRKAGMPIIHTQHCSTERDSPLRPGAPGNTIKKIAALLPTEPVLKKNVNSAFIGTDLESRLRINRVDTVILVGITTDHCVSTTARMAANLGFHTYVVSDATATFDRRGPDGKHYSAEEIHAANLASLHREFATVIDTETLLEKLASHSKTNSTEC
jgi:nicotinamidase-related amidase